MSEDLDAIARDIATYGWTVMRVSADAPGPDFAYSIGMVQTLSHPEILVIGFPLDTAHRLINDVGEAIRHGSRFVAGGVSDAFLEGYSVTFRRVPDYQYAAYLGWGSRFYRHEPFAVLQMIYPDREGRWPWQDGVSPEFCALQPVLADQPEPPWARDSAV
jgi:hypothetical protein